jgi:DNA-binding beta-propeller fold protein YncE
LKATALLSVAVVVACSSDGDSEPKKLTVTPAANSADFLSPLDATPDPKGEKVYFTAIAADGTPAVFVSAATGGGVTKLASGAPLVAPFGIAISGDGQTLFVADSGADNGEDEDKGAIFTLPIGGGTPAVLAGTEKTQPRGLEVLGSTVYFTGRDGEDRVGVMKTGVAGGGRTAVAVGEPFQAPSGIALADDGTIYVADARSGAGSAVYRIANGGTPEVFKDGVGLGYPAGVALSQDAKTLFISGREPGKGTDVVYQVKVSDKSTTLITDVFGNFEEAAGLHRAKGADVFAWADRSANNSGTVYVLGK